MYFLHLVPTFPPHYILVEKGLLETYYIILVNNVIDLLVCTLFGSELATEITLAAWVKATLFFLQCEGFAGLRELQA